MPIEKYLDINCCRGLHPSFRLSSWNWTMWSKLWGWGRKIWRRTCRKSSSVSSVPWDFWQQQWAMDQTAEYCGTQFAGKGLFKWAMKFDLKWPQCQSEGLPGVISPSYRQTYSELCPLSLLLVVKLSSPGSAALVETAFFLDLTGKSWNFMDEQNSVLLRCQRAIVYQRELPCLPLWCSSHCPVWLSLTFALSKVSDQLTTDH